MILNLNQANAQQQYHYGLRIYDVENVYEPNLVYSGYSPYEFYDIIVRDNIAYTANSQGLTTFDISEIINPVTLDTYNCGISKLLLQDNYIVAVKTYGTNVYIFDVDDPENIVFCDHDDSPTYLRDAIVVNNNLFICDFPSPTEPNESANIKTYDIANPFDIQYANSFYPDSTQYVWSYYIAQKDDYIFWRVWYDSEENDRILIVDYSDVYNPEIVDSFYLPYYSSNSRDIDIEGDYLYSGLTVTDISDINNIVTVDSLQNKNLYQLFIDDNYIYALFNSALAIFHTDYSPNAEISETIPEPVLSLHKNLPNPFNPQNSRNSVTTIEYSLTKDSKIELSIFNIKGQKVKTLYKGFRQKGDCTVAWNGKDENGSFVASGVYFYSLKTENKVTANKMLIIK